MSALRFLRLKPIKFSLFIFFLLFSSSIQAEKLHLSINYLGLNVVDVMMEDDGSKLTVTANATPLATIAAKMDNSYISEYIDGFLPIRRIKKINQRKYTENRTIIYDRQQELAIRTSHLTASNNKIYPIHKEARDFFTALFYIRQHLETPKRLYLDANSLIWSVDYFVVGKETIDTCIGTVDALKVELSFKNLSQKKKERSDMLTNNLVDENKKLLMWFSDDSRHLPLKTRYSRRPFPVYWLLKSFE